MTQVNPPAQHLPYVTRLVVIGPEGVDIERWGLDHLRYQVQDGGRTLKVWYTTPMAPPPGDLPDGWAMRLTNCGWVEEVHEYRTMGKHGMRVALVDMMLDAGHRVYRTWIMLDRAEAVPA